MRLIRFTWKKNIFWGKLNGQAVTIIDGSPWPRIKLTKTAIPLNKVKILAPYEGGKLILAGLNYKAHARELNMPLPQTPVIFLKPPTSVIGQRQNIILPNISKNIHYEAELAIVIRKKAKNINIRDAKKYILGYTCLNDVTARDLQKTDGQWSRAKGFDTFCPLGPWIDTVFDWRKKNIEAIVNGEIKQSSTTDDMIFPPEYLIEFISKTMTLDPGDIISTGTPPGVGAMQKGDTVTISIEGIGSLQNTCK